MNDTKTNFDVYILDISNRLDHIAAETFSVEMKLYPTNPNTNLAGFKSFASVSKVRMVSRISD